VVIKNTTSDANGARLQFVKDKGAAGADGDDIGVIEFVGDDAAQAQTTFAKILAEVSEADNTDEAGKLSFFVAESDGTDTALTAGLIIEGDHATDGQVDVTIGAGAASTTTVAGDLTVTGADIVIGADGDGTDRTIIFGHSTLKTIMGIDDSADAFVINTDAAFDGTLANNSFSIDASHNAIIAGNLTLGGKITGPIEVEQGSSGGGSCFLIDNDDTDQIALNIEGANIDANVVNIVADALTSANGVDISSNSSDNSSRALIKVKNDHASATGTNCIEIDQDSTGALLHAAYGAFGTAIALKVKEEEVTLSTSTTTTDVASFFPAGSVPIALSGRVTVALTNNAFIVKAGTDGDDDMFAASSFGDGQVESAGATFVLFANTSGTTVFPAADTLRITHNAAASGGGKVRVALHYWQITPATS
jgi:hypothetical protein